jgi:hypothetical protein
LVDGQSDNLNFATLQAPEKSSKEYHPPE